MSRFKLINLIDQLFISVCIFLVVYAWINFYIRDLWITFILSFIFSFAIIFSVFYFLNLRNTKSAINKKKSDDISKYHLAFRLMSKEHKLELLKNILDTKASTTIETDHLAYNYNNERHIVALATHIEKLTQNDLINILEYLDAYPADHIEIICNSYDSIKTKIYKDKEIVLIDKDKLYTNYFNASNVYPDASVIDNSITKFSWKDFLLNLFKPYKAKPYFWSGFILLISSIILPYHIYYRVIGSILIVFALTSKLWPRFKKRFDKS